MEQLIHALKALADPTRLRLLKAVHGAATGVCVCELVDALEQPQYQVSRHLAPLKDAGWLQDERHGTWVYYRVPSELAPWRQATLAALAQMDDPAFEQDLKRLRQRLAQREGGLCVVGYKD